MAEFILSAFADEAGAQLTDQLQALKEENISKIELRNVDGKSCADLTVQEADEIRKRLDGAGVTLSALGSPYGKAPIDAPFDAHLESFKRGLEICHHLGTDRIRMFSFFMPKGGDPAVWKDEVFSRLDRMLTLAEKENIHLIHENEKEIYGDVTDRCVELMDTFGDRMGFVFDPANFIQCGVNPPDAYEKLHTRITYMHVKDAIMADGAVVAAGHGDGQVAKIISMLNQERSGQVILTVEPHLTVFEGLKNLQSEELTHHESYPDSRTAFHAACSALRDILAGL